jgi:hypothetical protein
MWRFWRQQLEAAVIKDGVRNSERICLMKD